MKPSSSARPALPLAGLLVLSLWILGPACGPSDTGGSTSTSSDAGSTSTSSDAGSADAGSADAGSADAGSADAGSADAGSTATPAPAVILMIGDGMGFQHVAGGGRYKNGIEGSLRMETLPIQGQLQTASLTGLTDSAASGTTMATGVKTWNMVLGLDADMVSLPDLADDARDRGMTVGIVTTDKLTGATPGAFTVNVASRHDTAGIVDALATAPPDLMLGGGADDLQAALEKAGLQVVTDADGLAAADLTDLPLAGLFGDKELPYVASDDASAPALATLAQAALDTLDPDPEGFFLMIEGARIDHASHSNQQSLVYAEVAAFDDAVGVVMDWADAHPERPLTLVVTADHECGGLGLVDDEVTGIGEIPTTTWLWGNHTNADVPIYASGELATVLDGQRLQNSWVHQILQTALAGSTTVDSPIIPAHLPDGDTRDLGDAVVTQTHESSFGAGYNQLDALHLTSDDQGLWIGIDGVVDTTANSVFALIDLDLGAASGVGQDSVLLSDLDGDLDTVLTTLQIAPGLTGLGFDAAIGTLHGTYLRLGDLQEDAGFRGFVSPWGAVDDLWWLQAIINYDSGNMALHGQPAADAADPGETEGGIEMFVPWTQLYPDGLPAEGQDIGVAVVLADGVGNQISNQVLPPLATADAPGHALTVSSVVALSVDASGVAVGDATLMSD